MYTFVNTTLPVDMLAVWVSRYVFDTSPSKKYALIVQFKYRAEYVLNKATVHDEAKFTKLQT